MEETEGLERWGVFFLRREGGRAGGGWKDGVGGVGGVGGVEGVLDGVLRTGRGGDGKGGRKFVVQDICGIFYTPDLLLYCCIKNSFIWTT